MGNEFSPLAEQLRKECNGKVSLNLPLKKFSTFNIGGNASVYFCAQDVDDLRIALGKCQNMDIPYYVIGKGSNVLISDEGFRGLIIELGSDFKGIKVEGNNLVCGAGLNLQKLVSTALRYSLDGISFMAGIPGTVGGAIAVNAGAFEKSICEKLAHVAVFSKDGIKSYEPEEIQKSSYRKSFLPENEIILEATFSLEKGIHEDIKSAIDKIMEERKVKQPQGYPNIGSIFKNPEGISAGKLIEDAGWKGKGIGKAVISDKHANFILNKGGARSTEVYGLIRLIQSDVFFKSGIKLEPEIRFLGFFKNEEKVEQQRT